MDTRDTERPAPRAARAGLTLALVMVAAVGLLTVAEHFARPRIAANERQQQLRQFIELLPATRFDNDVIADVVYAVDPELLGTDEPMPVHRARLRGRTTAVFLTAVAPGGYGGAIRLRIAVEPDGTLLGVRVLSHRETPGLGDDLDVRRSDWIHGFVHKSLGNPPVDRWRVRKDGGDFDQFTGATVTPRAVVAAVLGALRYWDRHGPAVLATEPGQRVPAPGAVATAAPLQSAR